MTWHKTHIASKSLKQTYRTSLLFGYGDRCFFCVQFFDLKDHLLKVRLVEILLDDSLPVSLIEFLQEKPLHKIFEYEHSVRAFCQLSNATYAGNLTGQN